MKDVINRIGLFFKAGGQWLTTAPRYRGTLLCGLALIGAIIAIGYNGSKSVFGPSTPVTQTSDVVAARISALSGGSVANDAASSLPGDRVRDAEVVEPSPAPDGPRREKEDPSATAIATDRSFLAADIEKQKAEARDKDAVKKTAKKSAKKPQRRVARDKDRKFNPSREIRRAGDNISRVLRDIF